MGDGAVELLFRARDLVRRGWTQHAEARTADGSPVDPWNPGAESWSLLGAIVGAFEERATEGMALPLADLAFGLDALARFVDDDSLARWNDDTTRTQAAVAAALDAAAHAASEELRAPPERSLN